MILGQHDLLSLSGTNRWFSTPAERQGPSVCRLFLFLFSAVLWLPLSSGAQPTQPAGGGTAPAAQLQHAYDLGKQVAESHFDAEQSPLTPNPQKDIFQYKLADYMKVHGLQLSDTEKEVFSEAYWNQIEKERGKGGMTQIDPPRLFPPDTATTTTVTGTSPVKGPGTLQLTDSNGNSYFVDIGQDGRYSITVPKGHFQPVKMTLRTPAVKAAWELNDDRTWRQVSSASMTGTSTPEAPTSVAAGTGSGMAQPDPAQAVAYFDQCRRNVLVAETSDASSVRTGPSYGPTSTAGLYTVRFFAPGAPANPKGSRPELRFVDDPLSPDAVREAQKQGIDHADQQFEKSQLEKIDNRTPEQQRRLDDLNNMLKDYESFKTSPFANSEGAKITEDAAKARWLQRQAEALRAGGDPNLTPQAEALDRQARQLMGGQDLPRLRASAMEPLQYAAGSPDQPGPHTVAPGQSGYATLGPPATARIQAAGVALKGHSRLVATGEIQRQTATQFSLEPEPLAHLEEHNERETTGFPAYFGYDLQAGRWGRADLSLGVRWERSDRDPPRVAPVNSTTGAFEISSQYVLSNPCLTLNLGYRYDHVSIPIDGSQLNRDYRVTFNANPTWIAGFRPGIDLNRFQTDYMNAGQTTGARYSWTHWHTPFTETPVISSGQIPDAGYNRLSWEPPYKELMVYGELSPGTRPDPVPGLNRDDWPDQPAESTAVLHINGSWLRSPADE